MARKNEGYGPNIIADARRPGKLYVKVFHAGRWYKRRAASLSHACAARGGDTAECRRSGIPANASFRGLSGLLPPPANHIRQVRRRMQGLSPTIFSAIFAR